MTDPTVSAAITTAGAAGKGARIATGLAWAGLILALACGIGALLGGLGFRWALWPYGTGIQIVRWSATTDIAAIVLTLAATILVIVQGRRRVLSVLRLALAGLVVSLIVGALPLYLWRTVESVPRIHDISTDPADPPRYVAVLPLRKGGNNTDYTAEIAALQKKAYPDIAPAMLTEAPAAALQRAERAARAMGWEIVAVAPADLRIEATDTSLLFGFKDDVVIRITANGTGSRVDVRSLSRVGRSDFGVNAKRIRAFMKQLGAPG